MARRIAFIVVIASLSLAARPCAADDLEDLLRVVSEETDIATRTKMNRDYVPGILTVLDGDTLEALGCRTVLDALSLVPGMQTFREVSGAPNISVRGIAFPFNAGNTKVLINSVAISREDAGINSAALLTPIEQVERIEIVRGPSSSLHGAFAFAGVINIVTRDQGRRVFAGARNGGRFGGFSASSEVNDWRISASSAPYAGDRDEGPIGMNAHAHGSTTVLQLTRAGLSFKAENLRRDQHLSTVGDASFERSTGLEAAQHFTISPTLSATARVDYLRDEFTSPSVGKRFKGDVFETGVELQWKPNRRHNVLTGASFTQSHIDYATLSLFPLLYTNIHDVNRRVASLTLQDQIELGERLSLTLGLRGDHYSDVGSRATPRAGLVYRANDRHIFKAQYAEGFRPPTFWELYAPGHRDTSLDFEVMRTAEVGYVYHRPQTAVRATLFHSNIDKMLFPVLPPPSLPTTFANYTSAHMTGAEVEVERQESERFRWLANVSHVHTEDGRATSSASGDSAATADWLFNAAALYRPSTNLLMSLRLLHVGRRHTITGTTHGYDSLDLTTSFVINPSTSLRAGVRNLFNDDITYLIALPNATQEIGYARRTAWVALTRKF